MTVDVRTLSNYSALLAAATAAHLPSGISGPRGGVYALQPIVASYEPQF